MEEIKQLDTKQIPRPITEPPSHCSHHLALLKWIPKYMPLTDSDDRLRAITNFIWNSISSKAGDALNKLEIEARIGTYYPNETLSNAEKQISQAILNSPHMQILPFTETHGILEKNLFKFVPGIKADHFYFLKDLFDQAAKEPKSDIKVIPKVAYKDQTYSNDIRVSIDNSTNQVIEVIKKQERRDLNFQDGRNGIRISSSIEVEQKFTEEMKKTRPKFIRDKIRYSYIYEYMQFDFTKSQTKADKFPVYEIEIEIKDIEHMKKHINQYETFHKFVRRFFSNLHCLCYIIDYVYPEMHQLNLKNHYENFYGINSPQPLVGGYLASTLYRLDLSKKDPI